MNETGLSVFNESEPLTQFDPTLQIVYASDRKSGHVFIIIRLIGDNDKWIKITLSGHKTRSVSFNSHSYWNSSIFLKKKKTERGWLQKQMNEKWKVKIGMELDPQIEYAEYDNESGSCKIKTSQYCNLPDNSKVASASKAKARLCFRVTIACSSLRYSARRFFETVMYSAYRPHKLNVPWPRDYSLCNLILWYLPRHARTWRLSRVHERKDKLQAGNE